MHCRMPLQIVFCAMSYLQIPSNRKTCELTNSVIWFEDDGILYSRYKDASYVRSSREEMELDMKKFKAFVGEKKVLMLAESHPTAETPAKEDRDFVSDKLTDVTKAMAILTPSALSRMVVNLFFLFKPAAFPMKMFQSVSDAKKWLQTVNKGRPLPVFQL
jgi:hypothetical protein